MGVGCFGPGGGAAWVISLVMGLNTSGDFCE